MDNEPWISRLQQCNGDNAHFAGEISAHLQRLSAYPRTNNAASAPHPAPQPAAPMPQPGAAAPQPFYYQSPPPGCDIPPVSQRVCQGDYMLLVWELSPLSLCTDRLAPAEAIPVLRCGPLTCRRPRPTRPWARCRSTRRSPTCVRRPPPSRPVPRRCRRRSTARATAAPRLVRPALRAISSVATTTALYLDLEHI